MDPLESAILLVSMLIALSIPGCGTAREAGASSWGSLATSPIAISSGPRQGTSKQGALARLVLGLPALEIEFSSRPIRLAIDQVGR